MISGPRPKAILLDLDGTILDDVFGTHEAMQLMCREATRSLPRLDEGAFTSSFKEVRDWYWSDEERAGKGRLNLLTARILIVEEALNRLGFRESEMARQIGKHYHEFRENCLVPFPGAIGALQTLKDMGLSLALLTNGGAQSQRSKVTRFDLQKYFDHFGIEGEQGYGKPDPRVFLGALASLSLDPEDAWMVGDNLEADVFGAMQVGIKGIWMTTPSTNVTAAIGNARAGILGQKPDMSISSLAEMVDELIEST